MPGVFGHFSVNVQIIVVMALTTELIAAKSLFQAFIDFIFTIYSQVHLKTDVILHTHTHGRFWGIFFSHYPLLFI